MNHNSKPNSPRPEVMPMMGQVGRYTNKMHFMRKQFLKPVQKFVFAMPFMEPVDDKKLNVPTYYTVIKQPMDLSTIIQRLDNRYYHTVDELNDDIRLVIGNCYQFNTSTSPVFKQGLQLETYFLNVLDKCPTGEEILSPSGKSPKNLCRFLCTQRLNQIQNHVEKYDLSIQCFLQEKLLGFREDVKMKKFKTLDDLDTQLDNWLSHAKERVENAKSIYEKGAIKTLDNTIDMEEFQRPLTMVKDPSFLPKSPWDQVLVNCVQDKTFFDSQLKHSILFNTELIADQLCAQTDLNTNDDDDVADSVHPISNETELMAIQSKYDILPLEDKAGLLHILEQSATTYKLHGDQKFNILLYPPHVVRTIMNCLENLLSKPSQSNMETAEAVPAKPDSSPTPEEAAGQQELEPVNEPFLPDDMTSDEDEEDVEQAEASSHKTESGSESEQEMPEVPPIDTDAEKLESILF